MGRKGQTGARSFQCLPKTLVLSGRAVVMWVMRVLGPWLLWGLLRSSSSVFCFLFPCFSFSSHSNRTCLCIWYILSNYSAKQKEGDEKTV